MKDSETDFLGPDPGVNDSGSPARGSRVSERDERGGAEDDPGEKRFAVFGIEIPEEVLLSGDTLSRPYAPPPKESANEAADESAMPG
ncbi:MAG: hypothetical protein WC824_11490, partial [Bacteroidota bacterium]